MDLKELFLADNTEFCSIGNKNWGNVKLEIKKELGFFEYAFAASVFGDRES